MERMLVGHAAASALRVADLFLFLAAVEEEPEHLSPRRLQKLLFYAQARSLVTRGRPLFREEIEAWIDGPVVPSVFMRFARDGDCCQASPSPTFVGLSADDEELVRWVWSAYRGFSEAVLRNVTRYEDPWRRALRGPSDDSAPGVVTHEAMLAYFAPQVSAG